MHNDPRSAGSHAQPAMKRAIGLALAACCTLAAAQESDELMSYAARGRVPAGYPAAYAATVRAAEDEGRLVIYSTTDAAVVEPLIADFRALYPRIAVDYEDLSSTELHHRFIAENQLGRESADVLWSSAMDQQAALVSAGYAATYDTPEKPGLPGWASWNDQAYATTYEPVVFAYNKTLLPAAEVPQTHAELAKLLDADPNRFSGKVVSYNIEKSGLGFFLASQDAKVSASGFWDVARALGKARARLELTTEAQVRRLVSGDAVIGYNLLGAYTLARARTNPALGVVYPKDYTLVMSRIALVSKKAAHPNAARLWLDYLLSQRGQTVMVERARLFALRADVPGDNTAATLAQTLGPSQQLIVYGPGLTDDLDDRRYKAFILQWRQSVGRRR